MKTQIQRSIKHSLLIEGEELTSLYSFIHSKYSEAEITAECNDDSQLETEEISDIINFDNPNYRRITSITINARNSYEETLRIRINSAWFSEPVQFTIKSQNDEAAVYITQELVKLFSEMKPGYDLLTRISVITFIGGLGATYSLLRTIALLFGWVKPLPPLSNELSWAEAINLMILFIVVLFGILALFEWLRLSLFPKVFFMIGKQKKKMERLIKWRWVVFASLLLSILSSLIAGLILEGLKGHS
ncbi:MAG: hypothetical protein ACR2LC_15775 [Pyrinomonadaceae bacterium]